MLFVRAGLLDYAGHAWAIIDAEDAAFVLAGLATDSPVRRLSEGWEVVMGRAGRSGVWWGTAGALPGVCARELSQE